MQRFLLLVVAVVGVWPAAQADSSSHWVGHVVKSPDSPDLYYIGADGKRYFFPFYDYQPPEIADFDTHATWYADRSEVITISRAELETYIIGGHVTMRPGIKLVGLATDPRVYVVMAGGRLREISQAQLLSLYGQNWRNHFVFIPEWAFVNYIVDVGADGVTPRQYLFDAHPPGTLFRFSDNPQVYLLYDGYRRPITAEGMAANGFRQEDVLTIDRSFRYTEDRLPIVAREERLTTPAGPIEMFSRGDTNGDGGMDITDPIRLLNALFRGGTIACDDAADVNDDGEVDISDPITILLALFRHGHSVPYPAVGRIDYDPTADDLTCISYGSARPQIELAGFPLVEQVLQPNSSGVEIARFAWRVISHRPTPQTVVLDRLLLWIRRQRQQVGGLPIGRDDFTRLTLVNEDGELIAGPLNPETDRNSSVDFPLRNLELRGRVIRVFADLGPRQEPGDTIQVILVPPLPYYSRTWLVGPGGGAVATRHTIAVLQ